MARFVLSVNGQRHEVEAPPEMPLLWVLRDILDLTGTKYGCGALHCRACTVLLDGEPAPTCLLPVENVEGRAITTIEGLSEDGDHPVQRAWVEEQVPQCGYCQSGQILAAAALLKRSPAPTEDEIDDAMDPHLCRCGTYGRIRLAIARAAKGHAQ